MTRHKFPPRGYKAEEYPLPHLFNYSFDLSAEDLTKSATMCTILRTSEAALNADAVEVNPRNSAFAVDAGPLIFNGSIVPRINFRLQATMTKGSIVTDLLEHINFKWMPIYTAFLPSLQAEDEKTATQVEDIVELTASLTNKEVFPKFQANLTNASNQPLSTVTDAEVFGDYVLGGDAVLEAVAFVEKDFYDSLSFKTNAGMLGKVAGNFKTVRLTREKPYTYTSNNFTNPMVKRGNPFTYCGVLVFIPQASTGTQTFPIGDTTAISHIHFKLSIRYDEWNPNFDQSTT